MSDDDLVTVHLRGLPLADYVRVRQHYDGLLREFELLVDPSGETSVPQRLLSFAEQMRTRYGTFTAGAQRELEAAIARGDEKIDLAFTVPRAASDAAREYRAMLVEADVFCRRGDLLTLATPPDIAAFRDWYLEEFVRQVEGNPATPWADYVARALPHL